MNLTKSCHNSSVQDPWKKFIEVNFRFRANEETKHLVGLDTAEDEEEMRVKYDRLKNNGDRTFEGANHTLNKEGKKKKAFLSKALKRFQQESGIDESKYLKKVEDATSLGELKELELKFRRAGIEYYKQKMDRSGLFVPMDYREKAFVTDEKKMYFNWIEKQPLDTEDTDESSIIEALSHLDEHLEDRRKGRARLAKQSSYVKNEYFRQIGSMAADGSKEKLLEKILKKIGNFEEEPSAVQAEFKKVSAKAEGKKDTEVLVKGVKEEYEKRVKDYNGILAKNEVLFGGKFVNTPQGKKRGALKEFEDWFADRHSFAEMDDAKKRLIDTVLPERKRVYEERDELLAALPEGRRAKLREKTDEMRLHTLKAYLKESSSKELRESSFVLEYIAELETAEHDGYPLFSNDEKIELRKNLVGASAELQEAELKVLVGRMIPQREKDVRDYLAMSLHLRNDHQFFTSNIYKKRQMIREAKERENRELKNPFDIDNLRSLSQEDKVSLLLTKLNSEAGKREAKQVRKELSQEGKTQRTDTQMKVMGIMSGQWARNKEKGNTQVEGYMDSIYEGARVNNARLWRGAWEQGVAKDEHQQYMAETAHTDLAAYLSGRGRTWGGRAVDIGRVDKNELREGRTSMLDKFGRALYPENMLFLNPEGTDDLRPQDTGAEVLEESLRMELIMMLEAMGLRLDEVPADFKEALIQLAVVGENAGLFSRMNALTGGTDIVEEAVN